jgi:uncharacterized protein (TIGR00369 family)
MSEREREMPNPGGEAGAREEASKRVEDRVRESFARQGLMDLLGARIVEVGKGTCEIEVAFRDELTQQQRYFHGAVAGAIADIAGGYAALTLAPPDREVLTVREQGQLPRPGVGREAGGSGEVLSAGRRLLVCRAEVFAVSPS